jgi:hypothetical protein
MTRFSRIKAWATIVLPVLLFVSQAAAAGSVTKHLVVSNPRTGLCEEFTLRYVDRVTVRFFHSYDRQWVEESFGITGDRFAPVAVIYKDDTYDYRDQRYRCRPVVERNQVRLTDIKPRPSDYLSRIATRVAFTYPQQLILRGTGGTLSVPFTQWGSPGQLLVFTIE